MLVVGDGIGLLGFCLAPGEVIAVFLRLVGANVHGCPQDAEAEIDIRMCLMSLVPGRCRIGVPLIPLVFGRGIGHNFADVADGVVHLVTRHGMGAWDVQIECCDGVGQCLESEACTEHASIFIHEAVLISALEGIDVASGIGKVDIVG